ncbi:MAG: hypothetical protein ABIO85_06720 [Sphingomicrobium sp.]
MAPEVPQPAAPDEGEAAARWIADNGAAFGRELPASLRAGSLTTIMTPARGLLSGR